MKDTIGRAVGELDVQVLGEVYKRYAELDDIKGD
jgi:hypothetical protein